MSWTIRPGTAADVPALHALDLVCFEAPFRFNLRTMHHFAATPGAIVLVAEQGSRLCGFILVHLEEDEAGCSQGYIVTLDVAPEFRRMGLARTLLSHAERQVQSCAARMALHVYSGNRTARSLYQTCGYERTAIVPDFYGPGREGLLLVKGLQAG